MTANYWDYALGSNGVPSPTVGGTGAGTAVYNGVTTFPVSVDNDGGLSPYGTRGQNGNVFEWTESALDGVNDSSSEVRIVRGGSWENDDNGLRPSYRSFALPPSGFNSSLDSRVGFRVASVVPEPATFGLLAMSSLLLAARRRRSA